MKRCCPLLYTLATVLAVAACTTETKGTAESAPFTPSLAPTQVSVLPPSPDSVEEVVDGRTVVLSSGLRARVIGLAAPGSCWSGAALAFARETLLGKQVRYSRASESAITLRLAGDGGDYATLAVSAGVMRAEKDDPVLASQELTASKAGLGLWGSPCKGQDTAPVATPPPPPPPPATTTTTAPPVPECAVSYRVAAVWANGFHTEVIVRNTTQTPVAQWVVRWKFPNGQRIAETWGTTVQQNGADVVAMSPGGTGSIGAGGQISLRFNASTSGPNLAPAAFTLNGKTCSVG